MIKFVILALALALIVFVTVDPDAMGKCQETYSFDTCHATLNP